VINLSDLADKMLGLTIKPANIKKIEDEIIPESGVRDTGQFSSDVDLPSDLEVLPEYEFIHKAITEGQLATIFVTGEAGTGKSTLIHWLAKNLDNCALVAPTAVAASNIRGSTIHSFFNLAPTHIDPEEQRTPSVQARIVMANMSCLVIDEISMVPPNMIDAIDTILREARDVDKPFGGVHVIMVGDLFQLPPVISSDEEKVYYTHRYKSPFFFSADVFKHEDSAFFPLILGQVKRQTDSELIRALSSIRLGEDFRESLGLFNRTCYEGSTSRDQSTLCLVPRKAQAREINQARMADISGEQSTFDAITTGNIQLDKWNSIVETRLQLKIGARVIFLNNHREWINGDMGEVVGYGDNSIRVRKLASDNVVNVSMHTWSKYKYVYDYQTKRILKTPTATIQQYPIALGWALTIHKSQGMTLHDYMIDLGSGAFGDGQVYVALSRGKTLEGIGLIRPISMTDVKVNPIVQEFYKSLAND
jgi:ATP-dependent DNA helicase PIF1